MVGAYVVFEVECICLQGLDDVDHSSCHTAESGSSGKSSTGAGSLGAFGGSLSTSSPCHMSQETVKGIQVQPLMMMIMMMVMMMMLVMMMMMMMMMMVIMMMMMNAVVNDEDEDAI